MFNGMTVGFVGSLIWGPLLRWGSRILALKAFVQGGLQTDWLDSGQLLFKPSFLVPYCTHLALGRRVLMEQPKAVSPTHSQGRKSAGNSITPPALVLSVPSPTSAGSRVASVTTPASPALELLRLQGKLHPYTPLRCSEFERSLSNHPDKAWVSWLLHSIKHGISIGFNGPRTPLKSHNLISAYQHPDIINSELSKEIAAGRVLGPFTEKPFVNLRTSGLGATPKKNGKWRVILHLSAPYGISVNDGI